MRTYKEIVKNYILISGKFEGFTGEELAVLEFLLDKMMANTSG